MILIDNFCHLFKSNKNDFKNIKDINELENDSIDFYSKENNFPLAK